MRCLWLCFWAWIAFPGLGAQLLEPPRVEVTPTNATIHWITDVPTGTKAQVNPPSAIVALIAGRDPSTTHTVTITGLKPGVRYVFKVGTTRVWLATNSFTAGETTVRQIQRAETATKPTGLEVPPTRKTWGNLASLSDHFDRHGADFHARDADDYARMAWVFLQRARTEALPAKVDDDGVLRVFDPSSRAFASYNRDGTTKTFFKAQNRDYFDRQPGRLVNLRTGK